MEDPKPFQHQLNRFPFNSLATKYPPSDTKHSTTLYNIANNNSCDCSEAP